MARILIVEDENTLRETLRYNFEREGFEVSTAADGQQALELAEQAQPDAVILDVMLPKLNGFDVCRALRRGSTVPILMLTAKDDEVDKIVGLELGADDYLTKPFSVPELLARVKALFRRADTYSPRDAAMRGAVLTLDQLQIDVDRRAVSLGGVPVSLTAKEFDLLLCFAEHPGRVYTRAQLLDLVWGYSHDGYGHTVNSHINRLRAKIERDPGEPRFVLTVWGVGYKFRDVRDV